jgi:hypothetical protein
METTKVQQFGAQNQFLIYTSEGVYFQSYNSIIALKTGRKVILDKHYWDYSKTTGKYRNRFLGETKKETEKKIKEGVYTLANLNE